MADLLWVLEEELHRRWISEVYQHRGYERSESDCAAKWAGMATRHGNKTHAAIKALHLEELFGRGAQLCTPAAQIRELESRFDAVCRVDCQGKLGQPVAEWAMERACRLADRFGVGVVIADNAFHYLWGGGYVMEAARAGYIAYTNCTSALAEVSPFKGKSPTLGTNPHSWGFPTAAMVGFPIVMDFATSGVAMGAVQSAAREGRKLASTEWAVDAAGQPTDDPARVSALMPMGGRSSGHKGYMLGLLNELYAAFGGGSVPTLRGKPPQAGAGQVKRTSVFYFQAVHPDALSSAGFASPADRDGNVKAVLDDILGHGNREAGAILPGELEHQARLRSDAAGGLIFSDAEKREILTVCAESGVSGASEAAFQALSR